MHDIHISHRLTEELKKRGRQYCSTCGNWIIAGEGSKWRPTRNTQRWICQHCVRKIDLAKVKSKKADK